MLGSKGKSSIYILNLRYPDFIIAEYQCALSVEVNKLTYLEDWISISNVIANVYEQVSVVLLYNKQRNQRIWQNFHNIKYIQYKKNKDTNIKAETYDACYAKHYFDGITFPPFTAIMAN